MVIPDNVHSPPARGEGHPPDRRSTRRLDHVQSNTRHHVGTINAPSDTRTHVDFPTESVCCTGVHEDHKTPGPRAPLQNESACHPGRTLVSRYPRRVTPLIEVAIPGYWTRLPALPRFQSGCNRIHRVRISIRRKGGCDASFLPFEILIEGHCEPKA